MAVSARSSRKRTRNSGTDATYGNVAYRLAYAEAGALARPLERGGAEILRPRPKSHERDRALTRPRVTIREQGSVSVFAVVGFLAVAVFAALLLLSYVQLTTTANQVFTLRNQLSTLKTEETKLMTKYELAFDLSTIEAAVTADGSMVKPMSDQIHVLDMSEPDSVVRYQEEIPAEVPDEGGLLGQVKGLWNRLQAYFS